MKRIKISSYNTNNKTRLLLDRVLNHFANAADDQYDEFYNTKKDKKHFRTALNINIDDLGLSGFQVTLYRWHSDPSRFEVYIDRKLFIGFNAHRIDFYQRSFRNVRVSGCEETWNTVLFLLTLKNDG